MSRKINLFIISLQHKPEVKNSPFKAGLALNKASSSSSRMTSRPCPRAASQTNHFKTQLMEIIYWFTWIYARWRWYNDNALTL